MKYLFLIIGCWLIAWNTDAQSIASVRSAYNQAGMQVVLLKNRNDLIPIQDLSNLHAALITDHPIGSLSTALNHYISIPSYTYTDIINHTWRDDIRLFILSIDLAEYPTKVLFSLSGTLNNLGIPYIILFEHGSAATLPGGLFYKSAAVIYSWGYSEYIPNHIAQIIFGAEEAMATLPFFLNDDYVSGSGIKTTSIHRLKYAPPEYVGIEGSAFNSALVYEVEDAIHSKVFPGANLLVAKDGVVIFHQAFGKPTYDAVSTVHKDDLYDLASITKILGATLGSMVLHGDGRFDPLQSLSHYLPSFRKSNKSTLMWKDIMSHRARLPATITYYRKLLDGQGHYLPRTVEPYHSSRFSVQLTDQLYANKKFATKIIHDIKLIPLLSKSDYVYSDLSMILLFKTIEQITKEPFDQFLSQSIYLPIGADHTRFLPLKAFTKDHVIPTEQDSAFRHTLVHGYVHDENAALLGGISGHAGLFSNANDMAKLAQMLLNKGSYGGHQYLKPETIDLFTSYQYPELGNRRGLGFDKPLLHYDINASAVARDASPQSYGHSGFTGTFIWIDPKYNLIYILLTNRVNPTRLNNKISQYSIRPCIQQTIYDHMLNSQTSQ